jgi:hypothetical protein
MIPKTRWYEFYIGDPWAIELNEHVNMRKGIQWMDLTSIYAFALQYNGAWVNLKSEAPDAC